MHSLDWVTDIDRQTEPSYRVKMLPEKTFASHHVNVTDVAFSTTTIVYRRSLNRVSVERARSNDRSIDRSIRARVKKIVDWHRHRWNIEGSCVYYYVEYPTRLLEGESLRLIVPWSLAATWERRIQKGLGGGHCSWETHRSMHRFCWLLAILLIGDLVNRLHPILSNRRK